MTGQFKGREYHVPENRLETLVDRIFAIAMTPLVLGISPPRPQDALGGSVLRGVIESLVPQVFLFIVPFLVLAQFRRGCHRQFPFIHKIDPALV
jgi:uncharacterized membrane protein